MSKFPAGQDMRIKVTWDIYLQRHPQTEGWPRSVRLGADGPRMRPYLIRTRLSCDGGELEYEPVRVEGHIIGKDGRTTGETARKVYDNRVPGWLEDLLDDGLSKAEEGYEALGSKGGAGQRYLERQIRGTVQE